MRYYFLLILFILCHAADGQTTHFSFQGQGGALCAPSTVSFTHTSSPVPSGFVWDFGDGSRSNEANPVHVYAAAGTYQVTLTTIFSQSTATATQSVTIHEPGDITLSASRNFICTSGSITFTAGGSPQASYDWDFGNGGLQSTDNNSVSHPYNSEGRYDVTVTGTDVNGCRTSAATVIEFKPPEIAATFSPASGCIPAAATFNAQVQMPAGTSVTSYVWDFGDGITANTSSAQATHSYDTRGTFEPRLSVTTSEGCIAAYTFETAAFGEPPAGLTVTALTDTFCASETARFTAQAAGANQYVWQFGDGRSASITEMTAEHRYTTLGPMEVTVTPFDNGCQGTSATFPVEVTGVIAAYDYSVQCSQRNLVNFHDLSAGPVTSFLWDYGDGQQNDSLQSPDHLLPAEGSFPVTLHVADSVSGCADQVTQTVHTAVPVLTNVDTSVCRNDFTVFRVESGYNNPDAIYNYHIAGTITGASPSDFMSLRPQRTGLFRNFVVIDNGPQYCQDTAFMSAPFEVRGPILDFDADSQVCLNDAATFTNHSRPFRPQDSISVWEWRISGADPVTRFELEPVTFSSTGLQSVSLIATDHLGCTDTLTKNIVVNGLPFLQVIPVADTLCAGSADTLIAFHNDSVLWSSSNDLPCTSCDTLVVRPDASGYYAVQATSAAGCTASDTVRLIVHPQFQAAALNPVSEICPGDTVSLYVLPEGLNVQWSPAEGLSNAVSYTPVASPAQTTRYTALLSDDAGCFSDSAFFDVMVHPPISISLDSLLVVPYNSTFRLNPSYSSNVVRYAWSPAADLDCLSCAAPTGRATKGQTYFVTATSDEGCIARDSIRVFIECQEGGLLLPNAFTPNHDRLNEYFYPIGRGISQVRSFRIFNRYGDVVFSRENFPSNEQAFGWDGRVQGEPAPVGVYVYVIEAVCDQGQPVLKKGTISLIR